MIKKFIFIFFLSLPLFAQQDQSGTVKENQNVELPEFIITGVERVNLPVISKPKAYLVPILEESFYKPEISTGDLQVAELSNPVKKEVKLFDFHENFNGDLTLGGGIHTLPLGNFYYGKSFKHSLVSARIWGISELRDTSFSAKNNAGISLNTAFFVNDSSGFLPGAKFTVNGSYNKDFYKFYASKDPKMGRNIHTGDISFGVQDVLNNYFKFGITGIEKITYLKEEDISENNLGAAGFIESYFNIFTFGARFKYLNQYISGGLIDSSRGFLTGSAILGLKTPDLFKLKFGLNFANTGNNKILPYVYMGYKINDFLSAFIEYNPQTEFITMSDLLKNNRYYSGAPIHFIQENQGGLTGAVKYEYYTYFEISAGLKYDLYNHYPVFADNDNNGIFEVITINDAKNISGFVNSLFHLGPFGAFYGQFTYNNFYYKNNNPVPYISPVVINLNYSYEFSAGFSAETELDFYSRRHTSLAASKVQTPSLPNFTDLSLKLSYEISNNFNIFTSLMNILDQDNYEWIGFKKPDGSYNRYRAKPFDMILGINYRW